MSGPDLARQAVIASDLHGGRLTLGMVAIVPDGNSRTVRIVKNSTGQVLGTAEMRLHAWQVVANVELFPQLPASRWAISAPRRDDAVAQFLSHLWRSIDEGIFAEGAAQVPPPPPAADRLLATFTVEVRVSADTWAGGDEVLQPAADAVGLALGSGLKAIEANLIDQGVPVVSVELEG